MIHFDFSSLNSILFNLEVTLDYLSLRAFDFILHRYLLFAFKISFWQFLSLRTRFSSNRLTNSPRAEANKRRYYLRLQPWRMLALGSVNESWQHKFSVDLRSNFRWIKFFRHPVCSENISSWESKDYIVLLLSRIKYFAMMNRFAESSCDFASWLFWLCCPFSLLRLTKSKRVQDWDTRITPKRSLGQS